MSGKLFDTMRINNSQLVEMKGILNSLLPEKPSYPINFLNKDSHGDLDLFLTDTKRNRMSVMDIASNVFAHENGQRNSLTPMTDLAKYNTTCKPKERYIVQTENQSQLRIRKDDAWRHVDVTFVDAECLEFATLYYSYGDLSQLLQMWMREMKLHLKHTGLYYEFQTEGKKHLVRLTTNWYSMLDIMHLSRFPYNTFVFSDFKEAIAWMSDSILFSPRMININENDIRRSRPLFAAYLNTKFSDYIQSRPQTIDNMHGVLLNLPEAFTLIANAKINSLSEVEINSKAYALISIMSVCRFKKSNFDSSTDLNNLDEERYVEFKKKSEYPFL